MLKGLYSGRKIKATPGKLTRSQTGKQAMNAIIKKYGKIVDSAKYMHKGKGNWVRYSIENDRKRTGKTTTSLKRWAEQPHKLDYKGKDTKGSKGKSIKPKRTIKKVYRYASYDRPLWANIETGVPYKVGTITSKDNDPRHLNRLPKGLIITNSPIPREKLDLLRFVDMKDVSLIKSVIRYVKGTSLKEDYKDTIIDNFIRYSLKRPITMEEVKKMVSKYRDFDKKHRKAKNKKFAISQLKPLAKPKRRTAKTQKMKGKPVLKPMPTKITNRNILSFADKDSEGRYNFFAKFSNGGKYGNMAKSKNDFLDKAKWNGYPINKLIELKVEAKTGYNEDPKYLKYQLPNTNKTTNNNKNKIVKKLTNKDILACAYKEFGEYPFIAEYTHSKPFAFNAKSIKEFMKAVDRAPADPSTVKRVGVIQDTNKFKDRNKIEWFAKVPKIDRSYKSKVSKMKKQTIGGIDRNIVESAREDWNNQCKLFMSSKIPFKDKTAKACLERHKRSGY